MKTKTVIKLLISAVVWIIIDQAIPINQMIRDILEPFMVGPFLGPIKSLVMLCFFVVEIAGVYELLNKFHFLEKLLK